MYVKILLIWFEHIYSVFLFLCCHVFYFVLYWWCHFLLKKMSSWPIIIYPVFSFVSCWLWSCHGNMLTFVQCVWITCYVWLYWHHLSAYGSVTTLKAWCLRLEKKTGRSHPDRSLRADILLIWAVDLHYVEISYLGYNASAI